MSDSNVSEPQPVSVELTPLFEAQWSYEEFIKVMPFGPASEGQAFAHSEDSQIEGERLSGSYRMTQFPRWRADGLFLPDAHGMIRTNAGRQVMTRAGGYVIPLPNTKDRWTITHWMRFWTGSQELTWLNGTVAYGFGSMVDGRARVSYFAGAPANEPSDPPVGAPILEFLGTARWEYPEYESVRPFGDKEGVGFASSTGDVHGGVLEGSWRGWHYPTYLRDGLYQLDAHGEISGPTGVILNRHAGLATPPTGRSSGTIYDLAQHATFVTEAPELTRLNRTLALGVGFVRAPGLVTVSYYGLSARPESGGPILSRPRND